MTKKNAYTAPSADLLFEGVEYPECNILLASEEGPVDEWTENEK